jgi:hypothetical protein
MMLALVYSHRVIDNNMRLEFGMDDQWVKMKMCERDISDASNNEINVTLSVFGRDNSNLKEFKILNNLKDSIEFCLN